MYPRATNTAAQAPPEVLSATLRGWEESHRLTILDRTGSFFGRLSAAGILQRFDHPELDAEYDLDAVSFIPPVGEEAAWYRHENGARFWTGSINHLRLIQNAEFVATASLATTWTLRAQYTHQRTLQARRGLVQVAFLHDLAAGRLRAFASGTLKDEKPDMDFEGGVEWRAPRETVRAAVGALDVFSDFITQTLGVDYVTDSITDYTTHPFSARLALDLAIARGWRVEAYGFVMTPSTVGLTLASDPGSGFTQDERYAYGGALLEWSPTPSSSVGLVATHVRARMDRRPRASSRATDDFELLEQQSQVGAHAMKRVGSRVTTEA